MRIAISKDETKLLLCIQKGFSPTDIPNSYIHIAPAFKPGGELVSIIFQGFSPISFYCNNRDTDYGSGDKQSQISQQEHIGLKP